MILLPLVGISRQAYRAAVQNGTEIDWHCESCAVEWSGVSGEPVAASSRLEDSDSLRTSHESLHPPAIEISWGSQLEQFEPVVGHDFTVDQEAAEITFQLVEQGTKRGKVRLADNLGYTYNFHHRRSYAAYWQCIVRPKGNRCRASVTERDGTFQPGKNNHNHPAEVGTAVAAKIVM